MIECKDIDYILAISKHNNVSKAAEELFISQPALTKYLKNLESRLEVELFYRGKKQFTLTPVGELYVAYAKDIATIKNNLENELLRYRNNNQQNIRIGFSCTGLRQHIYHAVEEIRAEDPSVKITMQELTSHEIETSLLNYQMDLGFITLPATSNPNIASQLIMEEDILLGIPASHPLAGFGTPCFSKKFPLIDLSSFRNDQFILRSAGTRFRELSDQLFARCGFVPEIATTARNHFSCIEFAENWNMCVLTTETFTKLLKDPNSMRFFTAGPIPQKVPLGLVHRKGEYISLPSSRLLSSLNRQITQTQQP